MIRINGLRRWRHPSPTGRQTSHMSTTTIRSGRSIMHPLETRLSRVLKKLTDCRKESRTLRAIEQRMDDTGETHVSLTDPDCRARATTSKQPCFVGYNVQSAVETKHHLIIAHEVTSLSYDRNALAMMAHNVRDAMAGDTI